MIGFYASDILSVSGVPVSQTIGVATTAYPGTPQGGIMGVGLPQDESVTQNNVPPFPGYIDTLKNSGIIKTRAYSIYLDDKSTYIPNIDALQG